MNANTETQVFQTNSPSRWKRAKWTSRFFLLLALAAVALLVISLEQGFLPAIPVFKNKQYTRLIDSTNSFVSKNSLIAKKYGGFSKFIYNQKALTLAAATAAKIKSPYLCSVGKPEYTPEKQLPVFCQLPRRNPVGLLCYLGPAVFLFTAKEYFKNKPRHP